MFDASYRIVTCVLVLSFLNNELKYNCILFQFLNIINITFS